MPRVLEAVRTSGASKLLEMARTINELAKREEDARLSLCRAVANAMDMVHEEGTWKWRDWCDQHLRKPDGSKWSSWTLYKYASYGRDPTKLEVDRASVARLGRQARDYLKTSTAQSTSTHTSQKAIDSQVRALMFAWGNASNEARKLFLAKIAGDH